MHINKRKYVVLWLKFVVGVLVAMSSNLGKLVMNVLIFFLNHFFFGFGSRAAMFCFIFSLLPHRK